VGGGAPQEHTGLSRDPATSLESRIFLSAVLLYLWFGIAFCGKLQRCHMTE